MKNKNTSTFIECDVEYNKANIVMFGAPFDGTTSFRPGTRFAPDAIRIDSYGLENYSPYMDNNISDKSVIDVGDLEFPFGNTAKTLDIIQSMSESIINDNKKPFMIGGEHLVTLPQVKALSKKYDDLIILHLDAHTDLRDDYLGESLSHATVIRRCFDIVGKGRIFQFGIRSGTKEEFNFAQTNNHLEKFELNSIDSVLSQLKNKNIYLTIDLDVLDPSIFSGTGTPEPGGITYKELLAFLVKIKDLNFVGADVVELSPQHDISGTSTAVACKTIREVLCIL